MAKISELIQNVEEKVEELDIPEIIPEKEVKHTVFGTIDQKILDKRNQREEKKAKRAEAKAAKKAEKEESGSTSKRVAIGVGIAAAAAGVGAIVFKTLTRDDGSVEELPEGCDGCEECDCEASEETVEAEGET